MASIAPGAPTTMRAWVRSHEHPVNTPILFDGEAEVTIPLLPIGGFTLTSDPLEARLWRGEQIRITVWVKTPDGKNAAAAGTSTLSSYDFGVGSGGPTRAASGIVSPANADALPPTGLHAPSSTTAFLYGGDSISASRNSFQDLARRALGYPSVKSAVGGEALRHFPGRREERFATPAQYADVFVCSYSTNDLSDTADTVKTRALAFWQQVRDAGVTTVIQTTPPPTASTTDAWATEENQTPMYVTTRTEWLAWLRDDAPIISGEAVAPGAAGSGVIRAGHEDHPLTAIADVAPAVESATSPGKWKVGMVADGVHPSAGGDAALGAHLLSELHRLGY